MKKILRMSVLMFALIISFSVVMPVSAAKISNKKITLQVGQTKKLKVKGSKKKVKWSSSKKSVATVNSKGKVTAKKKGTAKITAKVGKKKYTCKVTVKKKSKTQSKANPSKAQNGNVTYNSYATDEGIVVIVKNNYSHVISVNMDCVFYNSAGNMLKKSSDSEYALEAGRECALFGYNSEKNWTSYKVNVTVDQTSNLICNASGIKYTSNRGDNNVMVQVTNAGVRVEFTRIAIVFYKNGKAIGYDYSYANNANEPFTTDYLEFIYPYDSDYNYIIPDDYKIYVNSSYRYSWQ